jgi:hypothetical protein
MAAESAFKHGIRGLLFFGGMEIGYNVGGQTCSAPQTTELRVAGKEGGGAAEETLWKWVWMANSKTLLFTTIVSLIARSWAPLLGGLVSVVDMHASYRYAVRCGKRSAGVMIDPASNLASNATEQRPRPTMPGTAPASPPIRNRIATPLGR